MRYFIIEEDRKYVNLPKLLDFHKKIDVRDLRQGSYYKIPKRFILRIQGSPDTLFPEVLVHPVFMVTEEIKKVLDLYEPNMNYKEVILLDQEYGKTEKYFLPTLDEIDCLTEESEFNLDHSVLNKIAIDADKTLDKCIFSLSGVKNRHIVVRLDFVESILRRNARGFSLRLVQS